ncbi:putative undecaprenyl diphosphate synthase-domain-containing protein [Fimicolochytrium jonesii]|uniref:putative undecaprenyl diphosphate synthase-domain-containing protein n=1 Tax=Fimicolochytrium jonesii TaxID=1396493 RepID=UPI0022FDD46F|nr:putative undecaprenyl diphosphate synthase-domain-containing protein [Fimicolochytrium jonesii]KAI8820118.1 putative undecaprenyl diphosphate synthase-domain-containing protein [Fimicolochytrium jonesii]
MELATAQLEQFALNTDFVHQNGIRVNVLGNTSLLPPHVLSATLKAEEATRGNTRVVLNICCPYTSRHEMAEAVNRAVGEVQGGNLGVEEISESVLDGFMGTGGQPDLDILVRTSGEKRLSDFLLWQVSKPCQIRFVDVLWPEFTFWDMVPILLAYQAHYPEMVKERAALAAQNQTSTSNGGKVVVGDAVAKTAKSIRDPRDPAIVVHNPGRVEKQRRMGSAGH